jgi:hypothetical protein
LNSRVGGRKFDPKKDICLHGHPNIYSGRKLYKHDITYFQQQAEFYSLIVFYFATFVKNPPFLENGDPSKRQWRDIVCEEVSYPPAENHPLHRKKPSKRG